ncbi:MAG: luxQ 3, partial [Myxococcaceae bacterium]|nr:luxQ 3 [Myxococcaceae bacterium]
MQVKDTGIGIDPATLSRLFQPFSQADASMTRRFGGSGLGLATSEPLARAMGGALEVETELNRGSTFTLRVPLNVAQGTAMLSEPREELATLDAPLPSWEPGSTSRVGDLVLLAEDGYDNQLLIGTVLRQQGFDVTVVENGTLAVEHALAARNSGQPYDMILMDMQMPELDGYGATAQLRSKGYDLPIIALTAHAMAGERDRCLAVGCDEYLSKPIDRRVLVSTVDRYANMRAAQPQLRPETRQRREAARPSAAGFAHPTAAAVPKAEPTKAAHSQLVSELAGEPEMAAVIAKFVERMPDRVRALSDAASKGDRLLLSRLAHQLKGAAGGYGFPSITRTAGVLEHRIADPAVDYHDALIELLRLCEQTLVSSPRDVQGRPGDPTLLVIDDSPETQDLVAARLASERVTLRSALTGSEGIALAFEAPPDAVLLDFDLPDMDGFR